MLSRTGKRALFLALPLVLVCLAPRRAHAWGGAGHRIVAIIAEGRLTPDARAEVRSLLGPNVSLSSVAIYADNIRNSRPDTERFHYVDIPLESNGLYDPVRDCPESEKGDCVIKALERYRAELADRSLSRGRRAFALKFIVHLVGDMHQPLHCAEHNRDGGGGGKKIVWFGATGGEKGFNLHGLWDSLIINGTNLSDAQFAAALEKKLTPAKAAAFRNGTPLDWAHAAHGAARSVAYGALPKTSSGAFVKKPDLGADYLKKARPVVDDQLTKAGVRLARLLNETLD